MTGDDIRRAVPVGDVDRLLARALEFSASARRLIQSMQAEGFKVRRKADGSFVTSADLRVEEFLRELIRKAYPDHGMIGEEHPPANPGADFQWIMDPIDGTEDFVHGLPTFGSILAVHYRGQPLVGIIDHPALNIRVSAGFGLGTQHNGKRVALPDIEPGAINGTERVLLSARANFTKYGDDGELFDALARAHPNHRIFRSCFAHTLAVTGQADASVDWANAVWDIGASRVLIEEAGGAFVMVREWEAPPYGRQYSSVMGKATLVDHLAQSLRQK